jgi:hypothetical protein
MSILGANALLIYPQLSLSHNLLLKGIELSPQLICPFSLSNFSQRVAHNVWVWAVAGIGALKNGA